MPATQVASVSAAQLAFVAALAVSDPTVPHALPITLHLLLAALGAVTLSRHLTAVPYMLSLYCLLATDFCIARSIDEPIVTMAFITLTLTTPMPVMLYRGSWPLIASTLVTPVIVICLIVGRPTGFRSLITPMVTINATILLAATLLMMAERRFGGRVDRAQQEWSNERRHAARTRSMITTTTEGARILHDTVVNTLGALAKGAPNGFDHAVVRERCREDVTRIEALLSAGHPQVGGQRRPWFGRPGGLPVLRTGLDDDELSRYEALLPPPVTLALRGCVAELMQNSTKHSGADHVTVDARVRYGNLVIVVADDGVGFDGRIMPGQGLAESVYARARDNGIRVDLTTAPGAGTRFRLSYPLEHHGAGPGGPGPSLPITDVVDSMQRRLCWTWAGLMMTAGVVTETINRQAHLTTAHLMLLLTGALSALAWWCCRGGKLLPRWLTALIVIGWPVSCVLAFQAIDFGWDQAFLLQTVPLTPLFAILLVVGRSRRPIAISMALVVAAIAIPAAMHPGPGIRPLVVVVILSMPLFAVLCAWFLFYRGIEVLGRRWAHSWSEAERWRVEWAAQEAADAARRRWNAVGVEASVALLRAIAEGELDPGDEAVRERCLTEEHYLREITSLTPGSGLMSWWFALALAEARTRSVDLHLRVGSVVVDDQATADALGRTVVDCVAATEPGSTVLVSLFDYGGAPRLFVVAPEGALPDTISFPEWQCRIQRQTLDGQVILEVYWVRDASVVSHPSYAGGAPRSRFIRRHGDATADDTRTLADASVHL